VQFDPGREASELRNQLSSDKRRLAFLFGAGTSQAVGIPGLTTLTTLVAADLSEGDREVFRRLLAQDSNGNLETVLDKVRLCKEMLGDSETRELEGLSKSKAESLDRAICQSIRKHVSGPPPGGLKTHFVFAHWLKTITRTFPIEIFTTNYDQLLETAMESAETPHFDGFVGSVNPFFRASSIDTDFGGVSLPTVPRDWVRLWKLHGSVGWVMISDELAGTRRIVRRAASTADNTDDELMVYPSRQKYSDSRRLPFMAYQDRLRRLLSSGETLLVSCGYSFGDEHLNEILFQSLRSNPRLAVVALSHDPLASESAKRNLLRPSDGITNLSIHGPDGAVIGSRQGTWGPPGGEPTLGAPETFWDPGSGTYSLGDFVKFVEFLRSFLFIRSLPTSAPGLTANA
jgi:hypothetical protein